MDKKMDKHYFYHGYKVEYSIKNGKDYKMFENEKEAINYAKSISNDILTVKLYIEICYAKENDLDNTKSMDFLLWSDKDIKDIKKINNTPLLFS